MDISKWTKNAEVELGKSGIPTPGLDAKVLLADLLKKDRSWIHAHSDYSLSRKQIAELDRQINVRKRHTPLAYIRGKQEFYGREFKVSPDTLTPRPETETMVEMLVGLVKKTKIESKRLTILDVGTGSGCIIVTSALELSELSDVNCQISFLGLDISKPALKIAHQNAKKFKADVIFHHFDLKKDDLSPLLDPSSMLIITANLPYVPENFNINLAASHEPRLAIFGGKDGLDYYRELFSKLKNTVSYVLTESLPPQQAELTEIAKKNGYKLVKTQDFIQLLKRI